ncbi:cation diffusion facilitator family transporter [Jeotgalicoccus halotolerans]|uniref:Cation diffusion facilitator family transporter n=1 Tax=Jeotgalicoccus halotolerans TaxID=157227 RepID=A0A3E0AYK1_9STAP|nr:cation diffusion facilitator family transporter [Jeotgalicoccus halotolerans]REG24821.1 cation diffusion facilitator family transporter [Jeotgalicoccus halotolerans]
MGNINKLKLAQRGAYLSIVTYIILSVLKLYFGVFYDSAAVRADALNNMTDIFASVAVLIGLKISIRPPDDNHPYGHLKSENIASLVVSFIIIFVGVQVLVENVPAIFSPSVTKPNPVVIYISVAGGLIMLAVYYINSQLAAKTNSSSLKSAAMDNLSDSLISLGTAAGLVLTQLGLPIADVIIASVLGLLIIYTGFKILKSAVFALSDGYNDADLIEHKEDVLEVNGVLDVKSIKGRYHGSSIFLDVTIIVDPEISVTEAHRICDRVEEHMHNKGIMSLYVHPEPLFKE